MNLESPEKSIFNNEDYPKQKESEKNEITKKFSEEDEKELIRYLQEDNDQAEEDEPSLETKEKILFDLQDVEREIEEVDSLISEANASKLVDDLLEERREAQENLRVVENNLSRRLARVENYDPYKNFDMEDYDRLVEFGILSSDYAEALKKINDSITKIESIPDSKMTNRLKSKFLELKKYKDAAEEFIQNEFSNILKDFEKRKEELKERVVEHHKKRAEKYKNIIEELESIPEVSEALQREEEGMQKRFEELKRKLEEGEIEDKKEDEKINIEKKKDVMESAEKMCGIIKDANQKAFKRIERLMNGFEVYKKGMEALKRGDMAEIFSIKERFLEDLLIADDNLSLASLDEIFPWVLYGGNSFTFKDISSKIHSKDIRGFLEELAEKHQDEDARQMLDRIQDIEREQIILKVLIGKKGAKNSAFEVFNQRLENDLNGKTDQVRNEIREKRRLQKQEERLIKEIINNGGVEVFIPSKDGKKQKGAVLVVEGTSKKGNPILVVKETAGAASVAIKIGATSPLNGSAFPYWLRVALEDKGIIS